MRARSIIPILSLSILCLFAARSEAQSTTHTVQPSETIYSIARDYSISPELLMQANGITNPRLLQVGAVLQIPSSYRVRRGDTLYGISRHFGVTLADLLKANKFSSDHILHEGDMLVIPLKGAESNALVATAGRTAGGEIPDGTSRPDGSGGGQANAGGPANTGDEIIGSSAFEAPAKGGDALKFPVSAKATAVDPPSDGPWPHPGKHYLLSGKFPGIMIKGQPGDPVTAVAGGRVIYTGPYTTFGRVVFVQSKDGYVYIYGGNGQVLVSPGDTVEAGTTIGSLGTIPFGQGAEVYFSVWRRNKFVDPEKAPRG